MSITQSIDSHVSQEDWNKMAETAGMDVKALKAQVVAAIENPSRLLKQAEINIPTISAVQKAGDQCESQSFNITLFDIIGLSGKLTLCGTSTSDWSAELQVCLVVAGAEVWCTSYKFDSHNLGVCFSPNVGIAKAKLCFQLQMKSNSICLNINGNACVWTFGWHCGDFDVTVFCMPLP